MAPVRSTFETRNGVSGNDIPKGQTPEAAATGVRPLTWFTYT